LFDLRNNCERPLFMLKKKRTTRRKRTLLLSINEATGHALSTKLNEDVPVFENVGTTLL
jgi:hypothetical protein